MTYGELGRFDLEWECCSECEHYYENGIHNGCLRVSKVENLSFPDDRFMEIVLDGNEILVECVLFEEKVE